MRCSASLVSRGGEVEDQTQQKYHQYRCKLRECDVCLLLLSSLALIFVTSSLLLMLLLLLMSLLSLCSLVMTCPASKEHFKEILRLLLIVILLLLASRFLFSTSLIVDCALLSIAQTHKSLRNLLKGLISFGSSVLIRVDH